MSYFAFACLRGIETSADRSARSALTRNIRAGLGASSPSLGDAASSQCCSYGSKAAFHRPWKSGKLKESDHAYNKTCLSNSLAQPILHLMTLWQVQVTKNYLIICNRQQVLACFATQALPIFLDRLMDPIAAVIVSVTVVLLFGKSAAVFSICEVASNKGCTCLRSALCSLSKTIES